MPSSHPSLGLSVFFLSFFKPGCVAPLSRCSLARAEGMAAEEASTRCQAFRRQPLGQTEGRLCVAWPVRCAAQSCVNCGSILCFLWEVRTSCSWWKAVPPLACSVDRAGRRRRSAAASAARRCSTLLPGGQHAGAVRDVFEAAVALHRKPRRVARSMRGAALGPDSARECPRWASLRGASAAQADASSAILWSTAVNLTFVDQNRRAL